MPLTALKIRGPFKGPSGYEHHVREFVREIHRQGVAVELTNLAWGPTNLPPELRAPWFETLTQPTGASIVLHFCMPLQVVPEEGKINVNYTMFEATRVPPSWVVRNRAHDLVVVPTESSRRAWLASGMPAAKLRLCPLGINPMLYGDPVSALPLRGQDGESLARYRVRFLNVSELGPRKNLVGLLRTWLRATTRDDDAVLIIKLGCYAPGWRDLFGYQVQALQERVGKRLAEAAPVHVVHDLFADAEMPRLYAAATHYISLSFGEGWDQAMVEAAASGLKLIAPDHSAYPAYLDESSARLIPSREVPAVTQAESGRGNPFERANWWEPGEATPIAIRSASAALGRLFAGASWWEPDEEATIAAIRAAVEGRDGDLRSPRRRILRELTWERATRRLLEILDEAAATRARRRFWPPRRWYRRD